MKNSPQKLIIILCINCIFFNVFSQRNDIPGQYSHSIGITNVMSLYKNNYNAGTLLKYYPAIMYNFRVDAKLKKELSISFTMYPTIGYSRSSEQRIATKQFPFCYELPVLLQLNMGNHSIYDSRAKVGSFIGVGFCYGAYPNARGYNEYLLSPVKDGKYTSICAEAGIKFEYKKRSYGVRLQYSTPMGFPKEESAHVLGFALLYNFRKHFLF